MSFRVHGLVKNTNDHQLVFCFTIKDKVLADTMGTQALGDNIAWGAQAGGVPDRFEAVPDLAQVFSLLDGDPLTARIGCYPAQV